ncbi:epidermal growth factor-like protein [Pseudophryne corroboree]|uniref:epidermal growth factor-like protein n=1 Tax=Pseudophryne corroboree TaxID=495146 RepID=UPI003081330B
MKSVLLLVGIGLCLALVKGDYSSKPGSCTGANEEYKECPSNCPLTCENRDKGIVCTQECRLPGKCQCMQGYVRNSEGTCVDPKQCPPKQTCPGANEEYKECPSNCPLTCENWDKEIACTLQCRYPGECQCKEGYVRNSEGTCVDPKQCPPKRTCTGANEEYRDCPSNCPLTCENWDKGIGCSKECRLPGKCQCKEGYVRNSRGACVHHKECPPKKSCRDANEEYKACPSKCPPTCENWDQNIVCTKECDLPGKCQCKIGYVRNSEGVCVRPKQCPPKRSCPENEEYKPCAGCEPTCELKNPICTLDCKLPGRCQCKKDFARDSKTKLCIPVGKCP